jgi:hypothetical protein
MNRPMAQLSAVVTALVLLVAGGARAQAPEAPPQVAPPQVAPPQVAPPRVEPGAVRAPEGPPPVPAPPATEPRVHVRSSHTVDVIAPGEKVDTILGRMRMERPLPPPRNDATRPPPGPDSRRPHQGPGRSGPPRGGEGGRGPLSPRTDGAPPPALGRCGDFDAVGNLHGCCLRRRIAVVVGSCYARPLALASRPVTATRCRVEMLPGPMLSNLRRSS